MVINCNEDAMYILEGNLEIRINKENIKEIIDRYYEYYEADKYEGLEM
ncbi:MAG: hypothetical protein ACLTPN_00900 [Clostridia bacterium]